MLRSQRELGPDSIVKFVPPRAVLGPVRRLQRTDHVPCSASNREPVIDKWRAASGKSPEARSYAAAQ